ncbi:outer dense fiber protein 3 isoform X2 [Orcinus orca]|nr:outer dense fiber protein 3 isoform X2 [Orcinus orca]
MLLAENCSPGPRYSVNPKILRTGKDIGPAYSILGRYCTKTTLTPGPGHYFPEKSTKHVFDSAPSHSISARTKTFRVDSTPGPAAYMLPVVMGPHTVGKASQPAFSIKGRSKLGSFSDDLHKTPGPAAYRQTDVQVTKFKAPQYTMAARVEPPGDKTHKPGPGAHSPEKVWQEHCPEGWGGDGSVSLQGSRGPGTIRTLCVPAPAFPSRQALGPQCPQTLVTVSAAECHHTPGSERGFLLVTLAGGLGGTAAPAPVRAEPAGWGQGCRPLTASPLPGDSDQAPRPDRHLWHQAF